MRTKKPNPRRRPLPRWAVIAVILVTGGVTAFALSASGLQGPQMAWYEASGAVDQVWAGAPMTADDQHRGRHGLAAGVPSDAARQVAGVRGLPAILNGTPRPHGDRGPCTNCHQVLLVPGVPMPSITSGAQMPHPYRGVCGNCHLVDGAGRTVAGTITAPVPPPAPPRLAEVDWLGLELQVPTQAAPTAVGGQPTAAARATPGAVVTKAEGKAARSGVQRGDIVTSINAVAIVDRAAFQQATQNGALRQGTVVALRNGQRLAFEIPAAAAASPGPAAQPMPPASPMSPMTPSAARPAAMTAPAAGPWGPTAGQGVAGATF